MQLNSLSLIMIFSAMISLFLALFAYKKRKTLAMLSLSLLLVAASVWALGYGLELAAANLQVMKVFAAFAYLGIATIPVFWLIFVARYTGNDGWLSPISKVLLFIIPTVSILLVATNNLHYLFYSLYESSTINEIYYAVTKAGPFWWVHVTYSYLIILPGFWFLIRMYFNVPRANRFPVGIFVASTLFPYLANVAYVAGFKPYGFLDITPIAFIIMGGILSFGIIKKRLMNVTPLAYDLLYQNLPDIILVIDTQGNIVNANPATQKLLDHKENRINKRTLASLSDQSEIIINKNTYTVSNTPILSPGNVSLGQLIVLHDITERRQTEEILRESEKKYRLLVDSSSDMIWQLKLDGILAYVSPSWKTILGYEPSWLTGAAFQPLVHPDDLTTCESYMIETIEAGKALPGPQYRVKHADGTWRWHEGNITPVYDNDGSFMHFAGVSRDITDRKMIEEALAERLAFEEMIARVSANFIKLKPEQIDEGINYALKSIGELFDVDRSYLFRFNEDGNTYSITHQWHRIDVEGYFEKNQDFPVDLTPWWFGELKNGRLVNIADVSQMPDEAALDRAEFLSEDIKSLFTMPLTLEGEAFGFFGFDAVREQRTWTTEQVNLLQVVAELITGAITRHDADRQIRILSFHDQLTGIYNRRYFEHEMERLDRSREHPIAVISADLDGLKLINDTIGHSEGDRYLQAGAKALKSTLRASDILARVGGDEFALLLPRTDKVAAELLVNRIRRRLEQYNLEQQGLPLSISLGLAVSESAQYPLEEIYRLADNNMYKDKLQQGKKARAEIVSTLLESLFERGNLAEGERDQVQDLAIRLGQAFKLPEDHLARLALFAQVYDLGKVGLPDRLIHSSMQSNTSNLTEAEREALRRHPETGYRIASSSPDLADIADLILKHHEYYDGSGYPLGLKDDAIPIECRILSVVICYSAMTNPRPYAEALSHKEVLAELKRCAGSQFDPELVDIFINLL